MKKKDVRDTKATNSDYTWYRNNNKYRKKIGYLATILQIWWHLASFDSMFSKSPIDGVSVAPERRQERSTHILLKGRYAQAYLFCSIFGD